MGVSRLDSFAFSNIIANGNPPSPAAAYIGPVNGLVTVHAKAAGGSGFSGGTISIETSPDSGTTWVPHAGVSITTDGAVTIQVVAQGIRTKLTGGGASIAVASSVSMVDRGN